MKVTEIVVLIVILGLSVLGLDLLSLECLLLGCHPAVVDEPLLLFAPLLADVLVLPLPIQVQDVEGVSDQILLYCEVQRRVGLETGAVVYF